MDEFLRGWTVAREIPADVIDGVNRGVYQVDGGVIRMAPGTDGAGQIIRHLIPAGQDPNVPFGESLGLPLASTEHLLQVATGAMALSGLNLAVSAVGFAVLYKKLTDLEKRLKEIKNAVDGIAQLLELEQRSELASALDFLSTVMQAGGTKAHDLLNLALTVLNPAKRSTDSYCPTRRQRRPWRAKGTSP